MNAMRGIKNKKNSLPMLEQNITGSAADYLSSFFEQCESVRDANLAQDVSYFP